MTRPADHPRLGEIDLVGQAVNMTRVPEPDRIPRPTPELGEHTDEVLREAGYAAAAIAAFRTAGVV